MSLGKGNRKLTTAWWVPENGNRERRQQDQTTSTVHSTSEVHQHSTGTVLYCTERQKVTRQMGSIPLRACHTHHMRSRIQGLDVPR